MSGIIVITGASQGIGAATARMAAERGAAVCVNYRASAEAAEGVVGDIRDAGGRAIAVQADMAVEADVIRLFATVDRELGTLTGLVNNAGIIGGKRLLADVDTALLRAVIDVNVIGCFLCAREAVRRMSRLRGGGGGAIVNVSSAAAYVGSPNEWIHYAASKGAIDTMTIGLSKEVAAEGIRVNAVSPGLIDTPIHDNAGMPGRVARLTPTVPLARSGSAAEVAEAILWLLSPGASYVTGANLRVTGGR